MCVNCDSLLLPNNADYCFQCCTQYDRRPGATVPLLPSQQVEPAKPEKAEKAEKADRADNTEEEQEGSITKIKAKQSVVNEAVSLDWKSIDWKARTSQINQSVSFSGKERKVCQKCHKTFPFFKTECPDCKYKFPKTRNAAGSSYGGMNTECYTIAFWNKL